MELTIDKHMHLGGTFVTNFRTEMWPAYREAVRVYTALSGDQPWQRFKPRTLILVDVPAAPAPRDYGGALHMVGDDDLSDFWVVFDVVAKSLGVR